MSAMADTKRTFAIIDIHGCIEEFNSLINYLLLKPNDTLILLGDYIDRGIDSRGVINKIIELQDFCNVIALRGNHETMMLKAFRQKNKAKRLRMLSAWLGRGGKQALASYMFNSDELLLDIKDIFVPATLNKHLDFIASLPLYHITETHIFCHASARLDCAIEEQSEFNLTWRGLNDDDSEFNYQHISGKSFVCGHTAQRSAQPLLLNDNYRVIDTGCFFTGWLSAFNVTDSSFIQANKKGDIRIVAP